MTRGPWDRSEAAARTRARRLTVLGPLSRDWWLVFTPAASGATRRAWCLTHADGMRRQVVPHLACALQRAGYVAPVDGAPYLFTITPSGRALVAGDGPTRARGS